MNRTGFISSIGAVAAVAFLKNVALAGVSEGPALMTPLVETLLPFASAGFPDVSVQMVVQRIETLYHLAESRTFAGSLSAFMRPRSFVAPGAALFAAEQSSVLEADTRALASADTRAYRLAGLPERDDFARFSNDERAVYLRLWSQSAFNTRRRFYQSVRFVTFAAFYSMPQAWGAIGYGGPLLRGAHE